MAENEEKLTPPAGLENNDFNKYIISRGLSLVQTPEKKAELWDEFLAFQETQKEKQTAEPEKENIGSSISERIAEVEKYIDQNNLRNEIYSSEGFKEYVLGTRLSEKGFNKLDDKQKKSYLSTYIGDHIGELDNLSMEEKRKYLVSAKDFPDDENTALMTLNYLRSFDKSILERHPEILTSKTMASAISKDVSYETGGERETNALSYTPSLKVLNSLYLAQKSGSISSEQFQATVNLRSPEDGQTISTRMLGDVANLSEQLKGKDANSDESKAVLSSLRGFMDAKLDTLARLVDMNTPNKAGEYPLDIIRSISREGIPDDVASILDSIERNIERKTSPENVAKLANDSNIKDRVLPENPTEMDKILHEIETLQKQGGDKDAIALLQAKGRKSLGEDDKTCDLEQKSKKYLGDEVYAIKDYLTETKGFKDFLNGKEPESITERNMLLKNFLKENPNTLKEADLHFQQKPQEWMKLKAKSEKNYNDEIERNQLLGVKDEKNLQKLLETDKKKYKTDEKGELSVSDSDKEEMSVSDTNREEMSVDDVEAKDAPNAETKDEELKKIDAKRRDGLDHPEDDDEGKGPFKEGDIIDYMYNEWMIALANKIYVKAAKKVKSWGESAYISFLQGLEDQKKKAAENRKSKKPKTTDTIDYYSKVERSTTGVMNKRIDTMNKSCDKLIGAYEKISQGDFSAFDSLPEVQKEMMLKRFNSLKEGKFPEEDMKKFTPEQQAEILKQVKENGGNPLKMFCKNKIDELNQMKNNFKLANEIAANYVCSKLGDAKIVDKDFDPKVAGLEEKYHLMAVKSILGKLTEIEVHNKDPKNRDNQKDSDLFLKTLSEDSRNAKKHTDKQVMRGLVAEHNIRQPYDSKTADKKGSPLTLEDGSKSIPLAENKARSKMEETLNTDVYERKDKEKTPIDLYEALSKDIVKDEQISETLSYFTLGEQRVVALEEERKRKKERAEDDKKTEKPTENTENKEKPKTKNNDRTNEILERNKNKHYG